MLIRSSFHPRGCIVRDIIARIWYAILGFGSLVIGIGISGGIAALSHELGIWAYPALFVVYVLLFALVMLVLIPKHKEGEVAIPSLKRFAQVDEGRFEKGVWPWVQKRGVPFFIFVATVVLGPFFTAILIRFLGIAEKKAWFYGISSSGLAVMLWVSIYLGAVDWIKSQLQ